MSAKKRLPQYREKLEPSQIAAGINAATRNATRLAADARLMIKHGRHPSAAALAILSIEESGKASILRGLAVSSAPDEVRARWRDYRSHTSKNVMGGLLQEVAKGARKLDDFAGLFAKDAEHVHQLDQIKQLALYTDCLDGPRWSEPDVVVDDKLSTQLVAAAELLARSEEVTTKEIELWIEHLAPVWNQDPGWMRKALENWYADMQAAGLAKSGPNAMETFINEGITGLDNR